VGRPFIVKRRSTFGESAMLNSGRHTMHPVLSLRVICGRERPQSKRNVDRARLGQEQLCCAHSDSANVSGRILEENCKLICSPPGAFVTCDAHRASAWILLPATSRPTPLQQATNNALPRHAACPIDSTSALRSTCRSSSSATSAAPLRPLHAFWILSAACCSSRTRSRACLSALARARTVEDEVEDAFPRLMVRSFERPVKGVNMMRRAGSRWSLICRRRSRWCFGVIEW
jgi:hypothetical protein